MTAGRLGVVPWWSRGHARTVLHATATPAALGLGVLAAWASAVAAPAEAIAALGLMAWFALPGWVLARRQPAASSASELLPWLVAGLAMTLVAIALVGLLLRSFNVVWVLMLPLLLAAALHFSVPASTAKSAVAPALPFHRLYLVVSVAAGLALATPAWLRVGSVFDVGVSFRPFFNADFFKHLGVAQSFALGDFPPADLFGAGSTTHYYWFWHLIAGTLLAIAPDSLDPVHTLLAVGVWQTAVFGALLYLWARHFDAGPVVSAAAVVVALAGLSFAGLSSRLTYGEWLRPMQWLNVEALDLSTTLSYAPYHPWATRLYRLSLYQTQHQLAAIFFVAWAMLFGADDRSKGCRWARMALVVAMPATSVLIGGPAVVVVAACQFVRLVRRRAIGDEVIEMLALPVALLLPLATEMVAPGQSQLRLAGAPSSAIEPVLAWRLSLLPLQWVTEIGVMFPVGIVAAGLLARRAGERCDRWIPLLAAAVACAGYAVAEASTPYGWLRADIELKLSCLLAVGLMPAAAWAVQSVPRNSRAAFGVVVAAMLLAGLPTPVHDTVWHSCRTHQCVEEPGQSTTIPPADWEALQWIRHHTERRAVFQQSPQPDFLAGGPDVWVPVFGGRAVYASRRGSEIDANEIRQAERLFDPSDPEPSSRQALRHGIDFLYISRRLDRTAFDALHQRYGADAGLDLAYRNAGVEVWRVRTPVNRDRGA